MTMLSRREFVYCFAIFISILLSFYIDFSETVINSDAICYLLSAESIATLGIKGAAHLCPQAQWPLYSALIYGFVNLTHSSYLFSAYFLNGCFTL